MSDASIWTRVRTAAATGRPPQRGRDDIVSAAVAVAERDGLAAVTMRRVAGELGTGAASLYRHLDTRDDLLDLMIDEILREYRPPEVTGDPGADLVADLMQRLRFIRRHPWLTEAIESRPGLGPALIRLLELGLERLAGHPAPAPAKLEAVTVLSGMVYTQARHERQGGALDPDVAAAQVELLRRAAADGDHPHLAEALRRPPSAPTEPADAHFARVLRRTLDGLLSTDE